MRFGHRLPPDQPDFSGLSGFTVSGLVSLLNFWGLAVAFLQQVFEQDGTALKNWQAAWQPIVARTAGPGLAPVASSPRREFAG